MFPGQLFDGGRLGGGRPGGRFDDSILDGVLGQLPERFRLAILAVNTWMDLPGPAEQSQVLELVARHLEPGGLLVLLSRVDVPFGVFLAVASVVVWQWGGPALDVLGGGLPLPGRGLLP